jgi:uncharacterized surface protein with fasciclin (FAS1) repeats
MAEEDAMAEATDAMAEEDAMAEATDAMADEDAMAEATDAMAEADTTLVGVAAAHDLSLFTAAAEAAGLDALLPADSEVTVFAPTDDAITGYLAEAGMDEAALLADADALGALLAGHVVAGALGSDALADGDCLASLADTGLLVAVDGDTVTVAGATIVEPDIAFDGGLIHVVDHVIVR